MIAKIYENVIVKNTDKGLGVFAVRNFHKGEVVIIGRRVELLTERTLYSLQIDFNLHAELDAPGRLINHSCNPNTGIRNNQFGGYNFIALFDISEGEEITWDYETTEYVFISVFQCLCNSSNCRGRLRGFSFHPVEIRHKYGEFIADYLKI
ncbi:SET domain-containing protein [Aerosakkonema funiforme]|uniref:SET domain-containing protein-lysine N-methyltransferase n=1 Tax=Aerosakkonema funiforme FACHB-1375 TaxID=2949571 RepID=A0A926ZGD6_9CYAN|nr:SET domain-containing protein-lysine N-methyltransferase [Aerosakkonema funiforme]MBD2179676.1 SET domain-containing protein-lysine N-methyltransferase [Aerosakkonema funiforme FACHB-1375]